ncbi:MAG: O-methyltransferase [Candidatus Omnitrophica bacterium]|nr:O-methyltransferase [Candidatus Omnitrophota bacterium]
MKKFFNFISVAAVIFSLIIAAASPSDAQRRFRDQEQGGSELEKPAVPKDENEKKILAVLDDIYANQQFQNVPKADGRMLRLLAEIMNAKNIVEIGTSTGVSGVWFGMALQKNGGKLTTFEIDERRAKMAAANFKRAGMEEIITIVLGDAHEQVQKLKDPIDMLFLDADKEGYVDYLNKLLPLIRPGGLIVAHNINQRMADPQFLEAINTNPDLETIIRMGMSFSLKKK